MDFFDRTMRIVALFEIGIHKILCAVGLHVMEEDRAPVRKIKCWYCSKSK